jgi:hypothetical protein
VALGQGPRRERGRALGVTAQLSQVGTLERDVSRHIHQQAGRRAGGRLERLASSVCGHALGGVDQLLQVRKVAAGALQLRLCEQQPGAGPHQVGGQRRQPPLDGLPFATQVVGSVEVLLDQPGGPEHLPGGHRVPDRIIGQPVLAEPARRLAVQPGRPSGLVLQPGPEQVGEQLVITPPAPHLIEGHQEQARPLHLLQQGLAAAPAGYRIAERAAEAIKHGGLQQEVAHLLALPLEHLLGQVVQHVTMAAGERRDELRDIRLAAQRQGRQLQSRRPPFGARHQRRHRRIG